MPGENRSKAISAFTYLLLFADDGRLLAAESASSDPMVMMNWCLLSRVTHHPVPFCVVRGVRMKRKFGYFTITGHIHTYVCRRQRMAEQLLETGRLFDLVVCGGERGEGDKLLQ